MKNGALSAIRGNLGVVGVFGIGVDNELYFKLWYGFGKRWYPSDTGWLSLGKQQFDSTPVAVQRMSLAFSPDVFATNLQDQALASQVSIVTSWNDSAVWPPEIAPWAGVGGVFNSPIEATPLGPAQDRIALVGLGTDNQAFLEIVSPGMPQPLSGWLPLGKILVFEPVIAWYFSANTFTIFGVGTDRQLYQLGVDASQSPPKLTAWQPAGGCFISAPTAVNWSSSRVDVFGVGDNQEMLHRASENGAWIGDWESLGGAFDSPAAVASWAPNRLDVFGLGTDDQIYHKWWSGGPWMPSQTGWDAIGGKFVTAPVVVSTDSDSLDIFGIQTDNQMYRKAWRGGPDWTPPQLQWEPIGGAFKIPQPTKLPSQLDFDSQVTFSSGVPVGGTVHITVFNDGTSVFSGHMHDSGFPDYNYIIVCRIIDSKKNAYQFVQNGSVSGTISPGGSRDSTWSNNGNAIPEIVKNWDDLFPCGGAQLTWYVDVNLDTATFLASIGTGGLTSVLNATFR